MGIRSLGLRSEAIFWRQGSEFEEADDHLIIRTPDNPGWCYGNLLIFRAPPREGDVERWPACFAAAFGHDERVRHVALLWDSDAGVDGAHVKPFVDANGYALDLCDVLRLGELRQPPHTRDGLTLRALRPEARAEVEQLLDLEQRCHGRDFEPTSFRRYLEARWRLYVELIEAGRGQWYGAFDGATLIGSMGIFHAGSLARFQSVCTHPDRRRQGVCRTLLRHVIDEARSRWGVEELVILAQTDGAAGRVYRSVGFERVGQTAALIRYPAQMLREADG